jgi:hypothetical protein
MCVRTRRFSSVMSAWKGFPQLFPSGTTGSVLENPRKRA